MTRWGFQCYSKFIATQHPIEGYFGVNIAQYKRNQNLLVGGWLKIQNFHHYIFVNDDNENNGMSATILLSSDTSDASEFI